MSKNELISASLKLEGQRFLLFKRMDACKSAYEWPNLQKELWEINMRLDQYRECIEGMKQIKRKMMRGKICQS